MLVPMKFTEALAHYERELSNVTRDSKPSSVSASQDYGAWFEASLPGSARELLDAAADDYKNRRREAAWFRLAEAAGRIGCIRGLASAAYRSSPKAALRRELASAGRRGGNAKRVNGEKIRDKMATALIAAARVERWPSLAAFQIRYHDIAKSVAGFSDNEYQRRALMKRPEIRALVPPKNPR